MLRAAAFASLAALASAAFAQAPTTLALRPGMEALSAPGVPLLWATLPDADLHAKDLTLTPATPYHWIMAPGQPFLATAASDLDGSRVVLTVWDWQDRPVAQVKLPGKGREELRFEVSGRGTYLLTLDRFAGAADKPEARLARSFSVCPSNEAKRDLWRASAFWPGVCSFPGRENWGSSFGPAHPPGLTEEQTRSLDAELSARLGMTLVRPATFGFWTAPDKPIDFSLSDKAIGCFVRRGFKLDLQMCFPGGSDWAVLPQYAKRKDPLWRYPRREDVVRKFSAAVAARYGRYARFVELYNEPDNSDFWRGTVPEFLETHRWAEEAVRKVLPKATIITGGLCLMDPVRTGLIADGVRGMVDGVGYHSHGPVQNLKWAMTAMLAVHSAAGYRKPVFYNTEMGYANWRLDAERTSAVTAVQKLLYCWAHGNRAALLYCSRDYTGGPRATDGDWGYLDYSFCPRFTYGAVAAFLDYYAGAVFDRIVTEDNGLYVYSFRSGDRLLVPVFVDGDFSRPITLETDAISASVVDPMGNASPLTIKGGRISVTAGYYPTTLILTHATHLTLAG